MARLAGVELNDNWKIDFALTRIKGIGWPLAKKVLDSIDLGSTKRISDLSSEDLARISAKLEELTIEGDLSRKTKSDIQRLQAIGTYRGLRHSRGLPAHGQRTRSNARTKRGKRKTVGAFKKEMLTKSTQTATAKKE